MKPIRSACLSVCFGLLFFGSAPWAQTDMSVRGAAIAALPTALRGTANDFLSTRRSALQRIELAADLAENPSPACLNFLVVALERETSIPVRRALVGFVGRRADERPDDQIGGPVGPIRRGSRPADPSARGVSSRDLPGETVQSAVLPVVARPGFESRRSRPRAGHGVGTDHTGSACSVISERARNWTSRSTASTTRTISRRK